MIQFIEAGQRLFFLIYLVIGFSSCQNEEDDLSYDLLLEKSFVIDGTGEAPFMANVLIKGDSIALIDKDTSVSYLVKKIVNAEGLVLTPGFIDTHAHGNPMENPDFKNFLSMGVTTICLGQDGASPEHKDLRVWMDEVNKIKPAVNIALFAGHGTLRMLSGIQYDSIPSEENIAAMEELLANAMEAGCFGMTTGLEYTPGYYADSTELNSLAKVVGAHDGLIMSHMRNEDDDFIESSIRELLTQEKHCPVHISHIKVVYGKGKNRAEEILHLLDSARKNGIQVTADFYPYTASYTGIGILFPTWAKKPYDYKEVLKSRKAALSEFIKGKVMHRNGPEATLVGSGLYKGKTLAQISDELNKPFEEVLIEDIGPYGASGAYFIMDEPLQETFLNDANIMICTDGSPSMYHPRGYGAFAKIIATYVTEKQMMSLREAIRKMSGLPAKTIGLQDRGIIKPGYKADILLFDPTDIQANATYENPHQLSSGFQYVIVNGKVAKEGIHFSTDRGGKVVKKDI